MTKILDQTFKLYTRHPSHLHDNSLIKHYWSRVVEKSTLQDINYGFFFFFNIVIPHSEMEIESP